jgi:hypothetical protein
MKVREHIARRLVIAAALLLVGLAAPSCTTTKETVIDPSSAPQKGAQGAAAKDAQADAREHPGKM